MLNLNNLQQAAVLSEQVIRGVSQVDAGCSIDEEVRNLVEFNRAKISSSWRPAFTEWANTELADMDTFGDATIVNVDYVDDRGNKERKAQYLVHTFWAIAMTALATDRDNYMSSNILARSIKNWIESDKPTYSDKGKLSFTTEQTNDWAMKLINALQERGVLDSKIVKRTEAVRDATGTQTVVNGELQFFTARFYGLTEEFKMHLADLTQELTEQAVMTCRPMKHVPAPWTNAKVGVGVGAGLKLIKAKFQPRSVAQPVLKAVNKLQSVKFVVSDVIARAAKDMRACNNQLTREMHDLFSDKELTTEEFDKYAAVSNMAGEFVHFPITMDGRGRMYYRGGILTPQGTDFCKAAFQFAEKLPLGKTGLKALYIHTANCFGNDKISIRDRVEWVTRNLAVIMRCESHWHVRKNFKGADVFQALAAAEELRAIRKWTMAGKKVQQFKSGLVCHQDGTCNGLQHSAVITGDRATAIAVNCVASTQIDAPADVYGLVADEAVRNSDGDIARIIAQYGRDLAKNPVMINSYGAGEETIVKNVIAFLSKKKNEGSEAFGQEIGEALVEAISKVAGGVSDLTEQLKLAVKETIKDRLIECDGDVNAVNPSIKWRTADGFIASTEYRQEELFRVREGKHAVRVRGKGKAPIDTVKTECAMSPNLIHSIDAAHCRMVVNACEHDLVTVHDSIGSHAGTYFATSKAIREQFVKVHDYDAVGNLCENLKQPRPEFNGDYKASESLMSTYLFS